MNTGSHSSGKALGTIEVMFLQLTSSEHSLRTLAVIALDGGAGALLIRFREDWQDDAVTADLDELVRFVEDLTQVCLHLDAASAVCYLQTTLPSFLRLTAPELMMTDNIEAEIDRLAAINNNNLESTPAAASDRFRLLRLLQPTLWWLRNAIGACARLRFGWKELGACAACTFAILFLLVAGWTWVHLRNGHLEGQHAAAITSSTTVPVVDDVQPGEISAPDPPDSRSPKRRKRKPRIPKNRREFKMFQPPMHNVYTGEIVMIVVEDILPESSESSYWASLYSPEVPPPPQRRDTTARRVIRTLGLPFRAIRALLSESSRSRVNDM